MEVAQMSALYKELAQANEKIRTLEKQIAYQDSKIMDMAKDYQMIRDTVTEVWNSHKDLTILAKNK